MEIPLVLVKALAVALVLALALAAEAALLAVPVCAVAGSRACKPSVSAVSEL